MKKKSAYLSEDDAEELEHLAKSTGEAESELMREGIRLVIRERSKRRFLSAGAGEGSGRIEDRHWTAEELYAKVFPGRVE